MKTLEVTDEQYAFIQRLREAISAEVVGKYGYVRERDAVQFLIDNLDGELDLELEVGEADDASATADVAASVAAELDDRESVAFDEGVAGDDPGEPGDPDALEADDGDDGADDDDALEDDDADEEDADDADGGSADVDDGAAEDEASDEDESGDDGAATDDDMLNRMMNLLDTHDDKWEESPSADYRYRVTLPDGTTEDVQTKDDVRALLFQHY